MGRLVNNIWIRIALVLAITMLGYVFLFLLPQLRERERQQLPQKHLVQLRAAINQNYLAYQSLATYRGGSNNDADSLAAAETNLSASIQNLSTQLLNPPQQASPALTARLKTAISVETENITQYRGRYYALLKPLTYLPETDIILSNPDLAVTHARAAYTALDKLANSSVVQARNAPNNTTQQLLTPTSATFRLNDKTQQRLSESATCFNNLAIMIRQTGKDTSAALETCTHQYKTTRSEIIRTVTEPLRSKNSDEVKTTLITAMQQLDHFISY